MTKKKLNKIGKVQNNSLAAYDCYTCNQYQCKPGDIFAHWDRQAEGRTLAALFWTP